MPQIAIEIEKTSKKFGLLPFLCHFCQIFDTPSSLERLKKFKKERFCCPRGVVEVTNAI